MKIRKFVLAVTGAYQIVRFFALGILVLVQPPVSGETILRNGILALSAGSLVTSVLLLQYLLTNLWALVTPLRTAKLLELFGSVLLFGSLIIGDVSLAQRIAFRGTASIILFTDTIVFLFLLLLPCKEH